MINGVVTIIKIKVWLMCWEIRIHSFPLFYLSCHAPVSMSVTKYDEIHKSMCTGAMT